MDKLKPRTSETTNKVNIRGRNAVCKPGVLTIYMGKPEIQLENQMVRAIPFGKLKKVWARILGDAIFLLF